LRDFTSFYATARKNPLTGLTCARVLENYTLAFSRGQQCSLVVLELPYSTEFGLESRKFASELRKYGKFSHFLTHPVVYGGQGKNKYYLLYVQLTSNNPADEMTQR